MYIKKVTGYIVPYITKGLLDTFEPVTQESNNWKRWVTHIGPHTCAHCIERNDTIFSINEKVKIPE